MVSSHQTKDLECFADSSNSLPRLDCNSTTDVFSFTLRTALSAIVSDLGVDVQ